MPGEGLDQPGESVRSPANSAGESARAIRRVDGLTKLQALQRVLYCCAKQVRNVVSMPSTTSSPAVM